MVSTGLQNSGKEGAQRESKFMPYTARYGDTPDQNKETKEERKEREGRFGVKESE